jgi:hypothetical protein
MAVLAWPSHHNTSRVATVEDKVNHRHSSSGMDNLLKAAMVASKVAMVAISSSSLRLQRVGSQALFVPLRVLRA